MWTARGIWAMGVVALGAAGRPAESFVPVAVTALPPHRGGPSPPRATTPSRRWALPAGYQEYGNDCIARAAATVGARMTQLDVQWKPGRIVITVTDGRAYLSDSAGDDDSIDEDIYEDELEGEEEEYDDEYGDDEDDNDDMEMDGTDGSGSRGLLDNSEASSSSSSAPPGAGGRIDLSLLARAVNAALEDDGLGARIAEAHEIEVTTPGASDELHSLSAAQLAAYRGFDVSLVYVDAKKGGAVKTLQGRLVGREDGATTINLKGRMKKISNSDIQSIRLPKAKKE